MTEAAARSRRRDLARGAAPASPGDREPVAHDPALRTRVLDPGAVLVVAFTGVTAGWPGCRSSSTPSWPQLAERQYSRTVVLHAAARPDRGPSGRPARHVDARPSRSSRSRARVGDPVRVAARLAPILDVPEARAARRAHGVARRSCGCGASCRPPTWRRGARRCASPASASSPEPLRLYPEPRAGRARGRLRGRGRRARGHRARLERRRWPARRARPSSAATRSGARSSRSTCSQAPAPGHGVMLTIDTHDPVPRRAGDRRRLPPHGARRRRWPS